MDLRGEGEREKNRERGNLGTDISGKINQKVRTMAGSNKKWIIERDKRKE